MDPSNVELVTQKKQLLKEAISTTKDKLDAMKQAQAQADELMKQGVEVDQEEYRKLQREIAFSEEKLKNYRVELQNVQLDLAKVSENTIKFGQSVEDMGKKLMGVTTAIGALSGVSIKLASDYEDSLAKVSTIADTTEVSMDDLSTAITDLSNQSGISSSEIAENVYNAISAGQKTGDAVNFVSNATQLARAGFAESGDALDILTTIMNAYGLEADKVTDVSDMLIQTQNLGKTTVGDLASAMGKVIPTANSMGIGLDQLTAGYTILTAKGIATAESTTYMNSMFNELGKSSTTVGGILKDKTGKSFQELMESGSSLGDVLGIIQDYSKES
ncbi:MAG: phage tail tape measure protein, partial [Parabacteroides sp.]|nr:phage tail tape measure protein [Parabacteroides sp.]